MIYWRSSVSMSTQAACAGQTRIQQLPLSLQETVFSFCNSRSQHALAQTCQVFWRMYHELICVPSNENIPHEDPRTACWMWRREASKCAAIVLGGQCRADLELRPLRSTSYSHITSGYHATLRGYFSQCQLQFILQHPQGLKHLSLWFAEAAAAQFDEKMEVDFNSSLGSHYFCIFTAKVYHNRQAGFSDDQLDKLGDLFGSVPDHFALYFDEHMQPMTFICEPAWQLISPSGHASCVSWHMHCMESVDIVTEVPLEAA